jgi:putative aminopeptidase FrvX
MRLAVLALCGILIAVLIVPVASAQSPASLQFADVGQLAEIPAMAGYEQELSGRIRDQLKALAAKTDNLGNVYVTLGSGAPHRLLVTAIDEPGYVVSGITPDGFLRVQRLPQTPPNSVFDLLHAAQPVWVITRDGKRVSGVFAGLSVHLQPSRLNAPKMSDLDQVYVDIGATSSEEARAAGVDLLDSVTLQRQRFSVAQGWAGPAVGDRFGCATLLRIAGEIKKSRRPGTTTIAFVTQQWTGGRGLNRILEEIRPDEMIYVGRVRAGSAADTNATRESPAPGSGVLLGVNDAANPAGLARELQAVAEKEHLPLRLVNAPAPHIAGYAKPNSLPERLAMLGIPTLWPATAGEYASWSDAGNLTSLIDAYLDIPQPSGGMGGGSGGGHELTLLEALVQSYGASGHEEEVRKVVLNRLDPRAQKNVVADAAGNLILHLGDAKPDAKSPKILFVAHMDEIGYQVRSIEADGRLLVDVLGGGYTEYFLGHVVLVHKSDGATSGGVLELPSGWEQPGFEWPHGPRVVDEPAHVYVGTRSAEETQKLGVKAGDWVTIPKEYRPLLGTRANARSFDDRVGCAALIEAVRALGSTLAGRDVTFVWSTEEEVGLKGAAAVAERLAKEGKTPDFVFAIDTFVSSDSPLESKRFADAEIGKGFVLRAVDNSNIAPRVYVDRVIKLARENNIPVQYGVTGGGNDGAVFQRYGSVDIPLGWPLRYSHSPGEVIDTRDVDALAKIIALLAKSW